MRGEFIIIIIVKNNFQNSKRIDSNFCAKNYLAQE